MHSRWLAAILIFAASGAAEARVFNYKDAPVAAYVRGTGGFSQLAQDTFANEEGAGTSVETSTKYNYGAELGFAFALGATTHLRVGAEIIQENPVNDKGNDKNGIERYTLNSTVFIFNPNIALEHVWSTNGPLRYYWVLGAGYANVTAANDYKLTDAGTSNLGGVTDFKESMSAYALSGQFAMGLETLFTDNVTVMVDAGYRYLPVRELKYSSDVTNFMGAQKKGDPVLNADGSKRTMNLGGLFVGLAFRFYLNFM
jgi:hypothetical protein